MLLYTRICFFLLGLFCFLTSEPSMTNAQEYTKYHLSRVAYENLLLEAEKYFSAHVFRELFNDPKVWECLSPMICALLGNNYYYDPYKGKCVQHHILNRIIYVAKPTYPELTAACENSDLLFLEYIKSGSVSSKA